MTIRTRHKPSFKIWLEYKEKPLLGKGGAEILNNIHTEESISKAAQNLHMSYRYVWNYLQKIEKTLGKPVVDTFRGGKSGGGGAKLTDLGESLLDEYTRLERHLSNILSHQKRSEVMLPKINARNHLSGKVVALEKNDAMATVKFKITMPAIITASVPKKAVENMKMKVGDRVEVIVKATEIMIAK
jgi:molybdate transport system regulatory protein